MDDEMDDEIDDKDERELERMWQRAVKKGAKLRKEGNVPLGAWRAYQRQAACCARVLRIGAKLQEGESSNTDELIEASNALVRAGEEESAYFHAMTNKEREDHFAAIKQYQDQKKKSGLPSV